jgi:hypothetical protein
MAGEFGMNLHRIFLVKFSVHHVGLIIMKKIFLMFFRMLPAQKCGVHCKLVLDILCMFGR